MLGSGALCMTPTKWLRAVTAPLCVVGLLASFALRLRIWETHDSWWCRYRALVQSRASLWRTCAWGWLLVESVRQSDPYKCAAIMAAQRLHPLREAADRGFCLAMLEAVAWTGDVELFDQLRERTGFRITSDATAATYLQALLDWRSGGIVALPPPPFNVPPWTKFPWISMRLDCELLCRYGGAREEIERIAAIASAREPARLSEFARMAAKMMERGETPAASQ